MARTHLPVLDPKLQISFYYRLQTVRRLHLGDALRETIGRLEIQAIDRELNTLVDTEALQRVASFGLRGELLFPVPLVLCENPFLLGYYRLLLGLSQKEFYNKGPFGTFKCMEEAGNIPDRLKDSVGALCESLVQSAGKLVSALDQLSHGIIDELQLLTLGPQFRGSQNTRLGQEATREVRCLIEWIVRRYVQETADKMIVIRNESGRSVFIEFFADPDVRITEKLSSSVRPTLSMEIKGGTDASNIHNRLGEAEKSHQKARNRGFREFWTIVRVDIDETVARRESPTTTQFFHLDRIRERRSRKHREFRDLLAAMIGIES